jgi:hypothetical protein
MKNSREYSKKIVGLYQSLKRKAGPRRSGLGSRVSGLGTRATSHEPRATEKEARGTRYEGRSVVDSIIYGIICERLSEKQTQDALKRFWEYFVDWNDLRVSRPEEIAELLGTDSPQNRETALTITKFLQRIFNESHQISLEYLQKTGKRPARAKLEKFEELSSFVIDYCMLTSLGGHTIPLTEKMIEYLKANVLVDAAADARTIEGFLTKQIPAKNGYEFYEFLREESEKSALVAGGSPLEVSKYESVKKRSKSREAGNEPRAKKKTVKKKTRKKSKK